MGELAHSLHCTVFQSVALVILQIWENFEEDGQCAILIARGSERQSWELSDRLVMLSLVVSFVNYID